MRILFVISLLALLAGVGVVALIETDPGYVLLSYGSYTLETSLWVGIVMLALALFLLYLVYRIVYRLISGQRSLVRWFGNHRVDQAQRNSTHGFVSYVEGNWSRARRQLLRGSDKSSLPIVNYLLAARASDFLQEPEEAQQHLRAAAELDAEAALAVEITRAEMHLRAQNYSAVVQTLENVDRQPRVLDLLREAYLGLGEGDKMLNLLPDLRRQKVLPREALDKIEREAHIRRLKQAAAPDHSADELQRVWQKLPGNLKQEPALVRTFVAGQMNHAAHDDAEKTLRTALKQQWDSELVRQYGLVESTNISAQLTRAERWLPKHPEDAQLLLSLGRISARDKLWGKARDYYESSYRVQPSTEVCAELGRLLVALGEPKVAAAYYREGLMLLESALPSLPMPDKMIPDQSAMSRS